MAKRSKEKGHTENEWKQKMLDDALEVIRNAGQRHPSLVQYVAHICRRMDKLPGEWTDPQARADDVINSVLQLLSDLLGLIYQSKQNAS